MNLHCCTGSDSLSSMAWKYVNICRDRVLRLVEIRRLALIMGRPSKKILYILYIFIINQPWQRN